MFKSDEDCCRFVCLSSVFGCYIEYDDVLYNPKISIDERQSILFRLTKEHFDVELNKGQLDKLCTFNEYECTEFVKLYKKYIKK